MLVHNNSLIYSYYSLCIIFWIIGYCSLALVFNKFIFVLELELQVVLFVCFDFFGMPPKPEKSLSSYKFMLAFLIITPFRDSLVVFDKPCSTFKALRSVIGAYVKAYLNIKSFKLLHSFHATSLLQLSSGFCSKIFESKWVEPVVSLGMFTSSFFFSCSLIELKIPSPLICMAILSLLTYSCLHLQIQRRPNKDIVLSMHMTICLFKCSNFLYLGFSKFHSLGQTLWPISVWDRNRFLPEKSSWCYILELALDDSLVLRANAL